MRPFMVIATAIILLMVQISGFPGAALADSVPDSAGFPVRPTLADYLEWSLAHSPDLRRGHHRLEALRQNSRVAGSLPDLKFMWGEMIVPVETRVGPQQRVFSLSQSIPWFGTLGLKEQATLSGAEAAAARLQGRILTLHRDIREAWYQLALVQKEEEILTEHLGLAQQAELSVRTSYEAGQASYGNLIKAQMELGRLQTQLDNLQDRRIPLTTKLNNLAGAGHLATVPRADLTPPFIEEAALADRNTLERLLAERNPSLRAEQNLLASAHSQSELASKEGGPELTVGLDYIMTGDAINPETPDSGQDPIIARLGVKIPIWGGRTSAGKAASAELVLAADQRLSNLQLELETRLEEILYRIRVADRNTILYGDTLHRRAKQDLQVTTAAYQSGQMDFEDLMAASQNLLGVELALVQAQFEHSRAMNDLVTLLGGETVQASLISQSQLKEEEK